MKFQRITKREVLIGFVALLLGLGLGVTSTRSSLKESRKITSRVINNCMESLEAADSLITSCSSAYTVFGTCIANLQSCDLQESEKKLELLNMQKQQAEEKIKALTRDMDSVIKEASTK